LYIYEILKSIDNFTVDGFRDTILADTAAAFTSCHAVVFIAISEMCFHQGHRLPLVT